MKLAWFTPFSTGSAIGHCSALITDELIKQGHEVTIFASDLPGADAWRNNRPVAAINSYPFRDIVSCLPQFDGVVYNLGNYRPYHETIYRFSQARPGITVLHDLVMHHFFAGIHLGTAEGRQNYLDLVEYSHGKKARTKSDASIDSGLPVWETSDVLDLHMAAVAARRAYGVIVHSDYARRALEAGAISSPVYKLDLPAPSMPEARPSLRSENEPVRLLTFGVVNPSKKVDLVIETIGRSDFLRQNVHYEVIGDCHKPLLALRLKQLIRRYDLADVVTLRGYQPEEELRQAMADADILVNLRNPHHGEASWSLVEALGMGKATMVWNEGFYGEFPEGVTVPVGSEEEFRTSLEELCRNRDAWSRIGRAARKHVKERFDPRLYASRVVDLLAETATAQPIMKLSDDIADVVASIKMNHNRELSELLTTELAGLARVA